MSAPANSVAPADRELARRVLKTEAAAILDLLPRVDEAFDRAVDLLASCRGRVIVTGMGKSGIICRKLAATFASTGTPAYFLHPAEAIHGDLGMVQGDDVVVALSYSGETDELVRLLEYLRRIGARLIALTGTPGSTLGLAADVALDCHVNEEACPLNLAPTASTTAALALGDALAMALLVRKGFRTEDFASLHPGGKLGKRLMRAEALMHAGEEVPRVAATTPVRDIIYEISSKGLGMTTVHDETGTLVGIITDGDLRRHLRDPDILEREARDVMTPSPITIAPSLLAVEALKMLESRKITSLVVTDDGRRAVGVLHIHDLWRTELF
ncbi:MAG: KpsF/GutQ family sugar-phosphate isomerase [Vicinamibacteraceae bacterium]|nr:KpsF/GutQ family sugar-phosphate isomerase [Vicinamibacteraceae bacterium]